RVQIAEPDRSVFSNRDELPTASVMLILQGGINLKLEQIKAIKNLVAYGIPRLLPSRVFVTDQRGVSLTDEINKSSSGLSDYRTNFERETAGKVQKVLQKIVGPDNVSVEVSAIINFDKTKTTVEQYFPTGKENNNPVGIISNLQEDSQEEFETYNKDKKASETFELEEENELPSVNKEKDTNYKKSRTSRDYKVSKEIKQVVYAPGKIERMTIAVALNKILTSTEKEEIKNLVLSASGANIKRGDIITVSGMQFAPKSGIGNKPILEQIQKLSTIELIVKQVGPLAVVLILGLCALFVLKSLLKKPLQGERVYASGRYDDQDEISERQDLLETAGALPAIEASSDPELEKMRGEINSTIMADPSEAGRLLLSYIKD
ncbi:MAG: hypothetical protein KAQ92_08435, partial [Candidatus Aenigmarchaeota archaeon]|nr:hypothetical protein [Candidatus Aenigmarchaeota archaeon]